MLGQMTRSEFEIIDQYFKRASVISPTVLLGIGDDAAVLASGRNPWVVTADTLVSGVHFFKDADPKDLGYKSLAVSLSDLAAMGASPVSFTLCLTLASVNEAWLAQFSAGMFECADKHGITLVGGDTTKGPLTISIQAIGQLQSEQAMLRRSGAQPGDDIWVSGCVGDAALGLRLCQDPNALTDLHLSSADRAALLSRLHRPTPRCELGMALTEFATSAIDVSDGLYQDLSHICHASHLGAVIELTKIPSRWLHRVLADASASRTQVIQAVVSGGDDYELCFTANPRDHQNVLELAHRLEVPLTPIGAMVSVPGIQISDPSISVIDTLKQSGYQHTW